MSPAALNPAGRPAALPGRPAAATILPPWVPHRRHAKDPAPTWRELALHWAAAAARGVWLVLSHPIVTAVLIAALVLVLCGGAR